MIALAATVLLSTQVLAAQASRDRTAGEHDAPTAQTAPQHSRANERMQTHPVNSAPPAAALLEYLGEFDDAADGLDAMGLAEDPDAAAKEPPGGLKERP